MKKLELRKHNEEALNDIRNKFKYSQKVCTIRATGTGKTYITLSLIQDYKNVLVMAPTTVILQYYRDLVKEYQIKTNISFISYTYAAQKNAKLPKGLDLIVCDEYHRLGGPKWQEGAKKIFQDNPAARILGLTATNQRMDGQDIAQDIFGGNISKPLELEEAWAKGILVPPIYVCAYYKLNEVFNSELKGIFKKAGIDSPDYIEASKAFRDLHLEWPKTVREEEIIKKFLPKSTKKIIVFMDTIKRLESDKDLILQWFRNAGFSPIPFTVHSKKSCEYCERVINDFCQPITELGKLKVMFSVDMLNEGIHIPEVDSVIFLRNTGSLRIYLQQLGRCFGNSNQKPIVFDFVGNSTSVMESGIYQMRNNMNKYISTTTSNGVPSQKVPYLEIHDFVGPINALIEQIKEIYSWDSIAKDIISRGAWEEAKKRNNIKLYCWIKNTRNTNPHAKEIWKHISTITDWEPIAKDIVSRKAWDEARYKNNGPFYQWVLYHKDTDSSAKEIWNHISTITDWEPIAKDIVSRKAWDEARWKEGSMGIYGWVCRLKDTNSYAKEIWNHISSGKKYKKTDWKPVAKDIISRKAWDEARWKNNANFHDWIRCHKNTNPYAKEIWSHITKTKKTDWKPVAKDIVSRKAWDEAKRGNNKNLYVWVFYHKDTDSSAKEIWNHISTVTDWEPIAKDIISRKAWDEAECKNNRNFYYCIRRNKFTNPYAKEIWNHITKKIKIDWKPVAKDIISRKAWDEAKKGNNKNLYTWVRMNKDTNPDAKEIWDHIKKSE